MLRLSTKGRYGTRAMLDLAINYGKGPILLKDIAKRQEISIGYLEQIIPGLKAAGLVNSLRGAKGGYTLADKPKNIKLKEIIHALEGPTSLVEDSNNNDYSEKIDLCVIRELWDGLSKIIDDYLGKISLSNLVEKYNNKQKSQPLMYNI